MSNRRRIVLLALALVVAPHLLACSFGKANRSVDLSVRVDLPGSIPWSAPFEIAYTWEPGEEFDSEGRDYLVFLHFVDDSGVVVAQDDHEPPVPTSQWRPGQPIEYRRWFRFIDRLEVEHVDVVAGLYDEAGRVAMRGFERRPDYPKLARLDIRLEDETGAPLRGGGWYELERSPSSGELWHWMSEDATAVFSNPRRDSILHMEASAPVPLLGHPQRVQVYLHDVEIADFTIDSDDRLRWQFPVAAADFGDDDFIEFRIHAETSVVPSEVLPDSDLTRRLGLKVFYLHLSSPGSR
jgi:hypothetical protein